ncbi:hypothetical protein BC936DRAFT_148253 [Jimgerdemannia flammicorona]|uniref:Uncharacterized protein n=1 Tax=Jimgerdemannia flammicorona TaxID=994334 RepID=A0A433D3G7_9FUNG|nr:hypothetical protein BC936DRAFT_148253 [Jimgerdemannia flammicorona]
MDFVSAAKPPCLHGSPVLQLATGLRLLRVDGLRLRCKLLVVRLLIDAQEGGRISDFWKRVMHSTKLDDIEKNTALEIRMFQAQHHIAVANRMLVGNDSNAIQIRKNIVEDSIAVSNKRRIVDAGADVDSIHPTKKQTLGEMPRVRADKAEVLSDSSDSESDDNGSMSPCEAIVKTKKALARKRSNREPREEKENDELWAPFKLSFSRMRPDEKWTLKSGKVVEDIMFAYGEKLKEESLIHSWILDLSDTRVQDLFTKEEWEEVRTHNMPKIPKVPKELAKHMVSYATKDDVRALRKKVLQSWLDPDVEYDPAKHDVFQYIHVVYERLCTWYEQKPSSLEEHHLENWYNVNLWSLIFDRCFEQLGVVVCISVRELIGYVFLLRGESCSIASSERKNEKRTLSIRKKIGRRGDGIFRERNGRNEFGAIEAAGKFDGQTSTKWLKESFKTPKVMHDMLVQLAGAVKNDPSSIRQLRTIGWLHFGLHAQMLDMDCANGRVCRLFRRELHHVGQGLNRDEIAATLGLLTAVLQSRYIIEEVYNVIKIPKDLNEEESLLDIIDKIGSSPESPTRKTLLLPPSTHTPKKK